MNIIHHVEKRKRNVFHTSIACLISVARMSVSLSTFIFPGYSEGECFLLRDHISNWQAVASFAPLQARFQSSCFAHLLGAIGSSQGSEWPRAATRTLRAWLLLFASWQLRRTSDEYRPEFTHLQAYASKYMYCASYAAAMRLAYGRRSTPADDVRLLQNAPASCATTCIHRYRARPPKRRHPSNAAKQAQHST